jgi:uncharacterized protein (DUF58 family)
VRLTLFGLKGVAFYLAMLVAFFATPYSNLFFLLLGFLTLTGATGILSARRNLRGVTAAFGDLEPVPSDADVRLPVEVHADGRPRFAIEARLELAGGRSLAGRVDVLERSARVVLASAPLPRGCYPVERALLESTHPFGIARAFAEVEHSGELVVYPSPRGLVEGRSAADSVDDLLGRGVPAAGDLQPSSLRDHREGDGVRGIHWRASARRGRLVVQEWEGGSAHGLEVVLDRRCEADELEESLATISAVVHLARTNKETLRFHTQDLSATFGEGHRPWSDALRFLAGAQVVRANGPPPPATSPGVARFPRPAEVRARA